MNPWTSHHRFCLLLAFLSVSACTHSVRPEFAAQDARAAADTSSADGSVAVDLSIARIDAPSAVRVRLQPEDTPRAVQVGPQDVLCLGLLRRGEHIVLQIGASAPQRQPTTELVLQGPGIEPGTYRTTPWRVLARVPTAADTVTAGRALLSAWTFPPCPDGAERPAAAQGRNTLPSDA